MSEATVKRWSDEGLLSCYRTPGGHRKFKASDVLAFASSHHFAVSVEGELRRTDPTEVLKLALRGDVNRLFELVQQRLDGGMTLDQLFDDLLTPALVEIGERWACTTATVAEEHVVTQVICDVLAWLRPIVMGEPTRGLAISACMAGEHHDVAARMTGLLLEAQGFRVLLPGSNTPLESLTRLAVDRGAAVLALSASSTYADRDSLAAQLAAIRDATQSVGTRLLVGGAAFEELGELPVGVSRVSTMHEVAVWLGQAG